MEAPMIHTVPTETLEKIEVDAALSNELEAYELVEKELDRRDAERIGRWVLARANVYREGIDF